MHKFVFKCLNFLFCVMGNLSEFQIFTADIVEKFIQFCHWDGIDIDA